jgi:hypothetical protein
MTTTSIAKARQQLKRQYRKISTGVLYGWMAVYLVEDNEYMCTTIREVLRERGEQI